MKIIRIMLEAVKRDASYLIGAIITVAVLSMMFTQHDWQSKPIVVASLELPSDLPDFASISNVKDKKAEFFAYLRPLIKKANGKIKYKKELFTSLVNKLEKENYHSNVTLKKMRKLAKEFGMDVTTIESNLDELQMRIDIIPSSLVLAQAANESAWGTSRFAIQANNLFGQWCYTKGCGLVPNSRNKGSHHEVRKYDSIQDSISSYMNNLNSHQAYRDLRNIRAGLRRRGQPISGVQMAQGLSSYSERGDEYVKELISMITHNGLE